MPISKDIEQTYNRFGVYIDELKRVMAKHGVRGEGWRSYPRLLGALKKKEARDEIEEVLRRVVALDGGKVAVGTIGMVVALSVGGVGIATMGTAYGISAATVTLIGTACGALLGNEFDGSGGTKRLIEKVGFAPTGTFFGHSAQLEPGADSEGEMDVEGSGTRTKEEGEGGASKKCGRIDEDGLEADPFEKLQGLLGRVAMNLEIVKSAQRRGEGSTEELAQRISLIEGLLTQNESHRAAAMSAIVAKLDESEKLQTRIEQSISTHGSYVASLKQQVERSQLDQSKLNTQTQEALVGLHRRSDLTLLAVFVATSLLIALLLLILRRL